MNAVPLLLEQLGIWCWLFALICTGLGIWFAWTLWYVKPATVADLHEENRRLYTRLQRLRESEAHDQYVSPVEALTAGPREEEKPAEEPIKEAPARKEPEKPAEEPGKKQGKRFGWMPSLEKGKEGTELVLKKTIPQGKKREKAPSPLPQPAAPKPAALSEKARQEFPGEPIVEDPELGILFTEEPESIDPLIMIRGTGMAVVHALNDLGIHRFRQIELLTEDQIKALQKKLGFPHIDIARDKWVSRAEKMRTLRENLASKAWQPPETIDHDSAISTQFKGDVVKANQKLGIVFSQPPAVIDALHRIEGIGPILEESLQREGIFRFRQVALWDQGNVSVIADRIGVTPERIYEEKWIPQAQWLQEQIYSAGPEWSVAIPTLTDYNQRIESFYKGEDVRADRELGIVYNSRPANADPIYNIRGILDEEADALNQAGIYRFRQIAGWADANVQAFARSLHLPTLRIYQEEWILQAVKQAELARKRDAFPGESFRTDPRFGILFYSIPDEPDDLTRVPGLSAEMARKLNQKGVHTFRQIALWEPDNIREFAQLLDVPKSRIYQEGWMRNARQLHADTHDWEL